MKSMASEPGLRLLRFLNRFLFIKINKVFVINPSMSKPFMKDI